MPKPDRRLRRRGLAVAAVALVALAGVSQLTRQGKASPQPRTAQSAGGMEEPLQPLIDAAEAGGVVTPKPGRYAGPVVITKPITLDGGGNVTVDGHGKGTVVLVKTDGATVKNLHITASGDQHNDLDAGLRIEGNSNVVKDNTITESLFGIDLQESHNNIVRRNTISSKGDVALGVKGDALRLWYSRHNRIEENVIRGSRDLVVWYSSENTIARNEVTDGRYGLHFMYAKNNLIEENLLSANAVGISLMYDEGDVIRRNRVFKALGAAGVGVGFKEASNITLEDNEILYNAVGLSFDLSPFEPESTIRTHHNRIAFNDIGVSFLSDRSGSIFTDNMFQANGQHVAMRLFESAVRAEWNGNYWDDYEGFDRDQDGFGDRPQVLRSYADRLWMDVPPAALFKGTPALSTLDFIERLAPFSEPLLLLNDERPRMRRDFAARSLAELTRPSRQSTGEAGAGAGSPGAARDSSGPDGRLDPFGLYRK